jgi:hypothetical protein
MSLQDRVRPHTCHDCRLLVPALMIYHWIYGEYKIRAVRAELRRLVTTVQSLHILCTSFTFTAFHIRTLHSINLCQYLHTCYKPLHTLYNFIRSLQTIQGGNRPHTLVTLLSTTKQELHYGNGACPHAAGKSLSSSLSSSSGRVTDLLFTVLKTTAAGVSMHLTTGLLMSKDDGVPRRSRGEYYSTSMTHGHKLL